MINTKKMRKFVKTLVLAAGILVVGLGGVAAYATTSAVSANSVSSYAQEETPRIRINNNTVFDDGVIWTPFPYYEGERVLPPNTFTYDYLDAHMYTLPQIVIAGGFAYGYNFESTNPDVDVYTHLLFFQNIMSSTRADQLWALIYENPALHEMHMYPLQSFFITDQFVQLLRLHGEDAVMDFVVSAFSNSPNEILAALLGEDYEGFMQEQVVLVNLIEQLQATTVQAEAEQIDHDIQFKSANQRFLLEQSIMNFIAGLSL